MEEIKEVQNEITPKKRKSKKVVSEENKALDQVFEEHRESVIEEEAKIAKRFGVCSCHFLNVRARPSIESAVLKIIEEGCKVEILSDKDEKFFKISVGQLEGYCVKQFIKEVK